MTIEAWEKHRSWFYSAGIAVLITLWLLSGTLGSEEADTVDTQPVAATAEAQNNKVRVRTQTAEDVVRTIVINGETAPARVVHISAETDGRVEYIGAERGANVVTQNGRARVLGQEILAQQLLVETEDNRRMLIDAAEVLSVIKK